MTRPLFGAVAAGTFVASVLVANWATSTYGFVPVGFGQMATAGTFAAGFALAVRDALQDTLGKASMLITLGVAALLSLLIADPHIAVASAAAFAVAELLDFAVYTPIRKRSQFGDWRWVIAVLASGVVGALADTAIFIGIAFGSAAILPALAGQLIGKAYATVAYAAIGRTAGAVLRQPHQGFARA